MIIIIINICLFSPTFTYKSRKQNDRLIVFLSISLFRFRPPNHNKHTSDDKSKTTKNDREKIDQILTEFGLDPSDYLFNSTPENRTERPSAFSKYSPQTPSPNSHPSPPIISGRPLSYVQHPPPPPPVINRQTSKTQLPSDMTQQGVSTRRTPPPPPSGPRYDTNSKDPALSAEHYLRQIDSLENPPVKVVKPSSQNLVYKKEIRIRYLQPPTPPPPAPIIIREKQLPPNPPESVRIQFCIILIHNYFLSS